MQCSLISAISVNEKSDKIINGIERITPFCLMPRDVG
jgi:hypothetical protein